MRQNTFLHIHDMLPYILINKVKMNQWIDHDDGYDDQVILESLEGTETTEIDTGNLKILAPQILMEEYTFKKS